jgi:hypothetical protein
MAFLSNDSSTWLRMSGIELPSPRNSASRRLNGELVPLSDVKPDETRFEQLKHTAVLLGEPEIVEAMTEGVEEVTPNTPSMQTVLPKDNSFLVLTPDPLFCLSSRPAAIPPIQTKISSLLPMSGMQSASLPSKAL